MSDYINPETIARYEKGFNKYAKSGKLDVLDITKALDKQKKISIRMTFSMLWK